MNRRTWIICALAVIGSGWAFFLAPQAATEGLVEVRVRGVTVDPQAGSPVVLLEALRGERLMPIWVGMFEARAIAMEMEKVVPPRPMTHDLMKNMLDGVQVQVTNIVITELKDNTFFAKIALTAGGTGVQIDARPSDAIALALRAQAPIFVEKTLFDHSPTIELRDQPTPTVTVLKGYGVTLQDLTAPLAEHFHLPTVEGVLVSDVETGSGAEQDGLRRGDIIVGANQGKVVNLQVLEATLSRGGDVSLQVRRQDKHVTVLLRKLTP
jgi:bifunctional DNase/RNase